MKMLLCLDNAVTLLPTLAVLLLAGLSGASGVNSAEPAEATAVLAPDALLKTPVGGLERTRAATQIVAVTGQPFRKALRVTIGASVPETNATQMTIRNTGAVEKGDALMASFYVRGAGVTGMAPARLEFLFERATDPWTKSVTMGVAAAPDPQLWKRVLVPFTSVESYKPGEVMVSLRFSFGPQTLEVADLKVVNYGKTKTLQQLTIMAAEQNPLGPVTASVRLEDTRQTMRGFGGNFAQPRYGATEAMDAVGRYNLENLRVVHARVGIPLNSWTPEKGVYREEGPARAALLQMQMMAQRKIPITGSVWEGPQWMLPGETEKPRPLPRERYEDCIEAVGRFLVTARDKYQAPVDYFSFNEPDYGVNFKFTPVEMGNFIRMAGPRFAALGLKAKFLTADTANGSNFADYARPLLEDKTITPYLGPLAFHSWDALSAPEAKYIAIAEMGRQYQKPVWCTEAGHDAQLWRAPDPWKPWDNALRTALAYERTLRLTGASQMDYWTYQDNYPLVAKDTSQPFPVWHIVRQMEEALAPGFKIATAKTSHEDLKVMPAAGAKAGQFSVLIINPIGAGKVTLTGLPAATPINVVQSTGEAPRKTLEGAHSTNRAGQVTVDLPSRSVVTLLSSKNDGSAQN